MSSITAEAQTIKARMPQWLELIHNLFQEISEWSEKNGWQVAFSDTDALDYRTTTNPIPVLLITVSEAPEGHIILEPQGLNGGGQGRIKMYASEWRCCIIPEPCLKSHVLRTMP